MKECKFINDIFEAYKNDILTGTEKDKLRFFYIALENAERESRQAAVAEVYRTVDSLVNKRHYDQE